MGKVFWIVATLVLVIIAGYYIFVAPYGNPITGNVANTESVISGGEKKTFVLTGENFKFVMNGFDNPTLKVNQGDKVQIVFTSTLGFHDFIIDEFFVATERVRDDEGPTTVEFVAGKKGTFEYYCSVGQHRASGMRGNFIVE